MAKIDDVLRIAGVEDCPYKPIDCALAPGCFELDTAIVGAMKIWQRLASVSEETGYYPVFPVKEDIAGLMPIIMAGSGSASTELVDQLIAAGRIPSLDSLTDYKSFDLDRWIASSTAKCEVGNFSKQRFGHPAPSASCNLILAPVKFSWQIPALLRLGGWNGHPHTVAHVAMQKRWFDNYGAQIVSIGIDSMYMTVARPVRNREDALALAAEHFTYCSDNIMQGMGDFTLSGAAIDLIDSGSWHFWWD